ncbi:MAG: hypothetical protein IJI78_08085 [Oscillospiraceae bacterium]|nr:hypothetical protein [Oscillospiraceae bacterium]
MILFILETPFLFSFNFVSDKKPDRFEKAVHVDETNKEVPMAMIALHKVL